MAVLTATFLDALTLDRPDVYVSGNLFVYYRQGVPDAVVAPDVFVVFGVPKIQRTTYKVWLEGGKVPSFVLEITSKTTQENDQRDKPGRYARMGVLEYFQYDPTGDYLSPVLQGQRLVAGAYQPIVATPLPDGSVSTNSQALGLELRLSQGALRFYTQTGERLPSFEEERERAIAAQERADRLAAENARLRELLKQQGLNPEELP
ncbi:MAG: Uma2 family endonuclease [Coleofasciculaceae cyanobacterium SM2_3_26]|nr:Uma2 family endonuclease [Coleofasciculaceae cyanobacterium SM2_3_26]